MLDSLFGSFDNIIVFDVETTGFYPNRDEIIEIAMLRIVKKEDTHIVEEEFSSLVKLSPKRTLQAVITNLTGITEQQLLEKGDLKENVCNKVADLLGCQRPLLVAYNAHFDLSFLISFLNRYKKQEALANVKMLDAMTIYKDRRPYPHKLSDAVLAYSVKTSNAHRALDDAGATFKLLCEMGRESDDLERYVNLFGFNPKYGVTGPKIPTVRYLPQGYNRTKKLYEE